MTKTKAAKLLGIHPMKLSLLLQQNKLPDVGVAYKNKKGNWSYYIKDSYFKELKE